MKRKSYYYTNSDNTKGNNTSTCSCNVGCQHKNNTSYYIYYCNNTPQCCTNYCSSEPEPCDTITIPIVCEPYPTIPSCSSTIPNCNLSNTLNPIILANSSYEHSSYIQLFDRNNTNSLHSVKEFLNLSNEGILPKYSTGQYTLTSTNSIPNSVLNILEPGIYDVSIALKCSFSLPTNSLIPETSYNIIFSVLSNQDLLLSSMDIYSLIPGSTNTLIKHSLSTRFLLNATSTPYPLSIRLEDFKFNIASKNTLLVSDITLIVKKL